MFDNFFSEYHAIYEVMWKNVQNMDTFDCLKIIPHVEVLYKSQNVCL
jgi:hypothetical protein